MTKFIHKLPIYPSWDQVKIYFEMENKERHGKIDYEIWENTIFSFDG